MPGCCRTPNYLGGDDYNIRGRSNVMTMKKYEWLQKIGPLPKLVQAGLSYLGLKEYPGPSSNPVIMQMAKDLGVSNIYTNDDMSWCALFMCYLCKITGKPMPYRSYEILRAASFATWGNPVARGDERLGDIAVFKRPGGNHVGIVIAVTATTIVVLGGNQSNAVTITEIAKTRLSACRRYYSIAAPESAIQYVVSSTGKLSTNEA